MTNALEKELDIIYPLIVPTSYASSSWDLPNYKFPNTDYMLTWVLFRSEGTMTYITREKFDTFNATFENWEQITFENLRDSTGPSDNFFQHYRTSETDNSLSFIFFSNEDGIGSSRILFSHEFEQTFPEGYQVAMPDRSVGIVISKNISSAEQKVLQKIIKDTYGCTGTAMSKKVMEPTDFLLPKEWLEPADVDLSNWMISAVLNCRH
jgi:hypothetical protein